METINNILKRKHVENVNVDKDIYNNVNVEELVRKIKEATDKPKAIGSILAEELGAPENLRFYIKLTYIYSQETLFECVALTKEAHREGRIYSTLGQYFYGIVRRKKKK